MEANHFYQEVFVDAGVCFHDDDESVTAITLSDDNSINDDVMMPDSRSQLSVSSVHDHRESSVTTAKQMSEACHQCSSSYIPTTLRTQRTQLLLHHDRATTTSSTVSVVGQLHLCQYW